MRAKLNDLIKKLALTNTEDTLFNPYNEISKNFDDRAAPGIRQQNLRIYLDSHKKLKTKQLWIYLSPSYFELKRSGVPLTNTSGFKHLEGMLETKKRFEKASKPRVVSNTTPLASSLWSIAEELDINPIIWPLIPFYPQKKENPTRKRKPKKEEILKYGQFLKTIIKIYKPKSILAIGGDTKKGLDLLGIDSTYVKHPRSSKKDFKKAVLRHS